MQPTATINRRASTRRGTLTAGSRRGSALRGANAIANGQGTPIQPAKMELLAEFRAHEEDCAARVLQRAARGYLGRSFVSKLLLKVYEKQYDPITKSYFYINTTTNETSWEKPKALQLFLPSTKDVGTRSIDLGPSEAAKRIQRLARMFLSISQMKALIRENYMKLFNPETKTFYYLNTRTGAIADHRPPFLRKETDDLEVEMFHFRRAVCKVTTPTNQYGSGVLGQFCGVLCLLTDGQTLRTEESTRSARVVCNYVDGSVPFPIYLTPERLFVSIAVPPDGAEFTICAVDAEQFEGLAQKNVKPLKLELNDRKMGCADGSMRVQDPIEVVGYPHGKPQVVHSRILAKMLPHSIAPVRMVYDKEMESGAAGCAIFTRGGKLLGMQHYTSLKDPPPIDFYYIRPILDAAKGLVTPPQPSLLTTCIASTEVHVYWQTVRWIKPVRGLALAFELEICRHDGKQVKYHGDFERVYSGTHRSKHIGGLESDTMYSVRCRGSNAIAKSAWSLVMRFITPPRASIAWRVRYCTSLTDAITRIRRNHPSRQGRITGGGGDPLVHSQCLEWIYNYHDRLKDEELRQAEQELIACGGVDEIMDAIMTWLQEDDQSVRWTLRVLIQVSQRRERSQQSLSTLPRIQYLVESLRGHTARLMSENKTESPQPSDSETVVIKTDDDGDQPEHNQTTDDDEKNDEARHELPPPPPSSIRMDLVLLTVSLLGHVVDSNASAKQIFQVTGAMSLILELLAIETLRAHTAFVTECCYLLGRYTHNHSMAGKWVIVECSGLDVLRNVCIDYETDPKIMYWSMVTLGNIAYGCSPEGHAQLEARTNTLRLIDVICRVKMLYLLRLNELELQVVASEAERARLQANLMGEDMRNELDACEHVIFTLEHAIADLQDHHVGQAADFALHYILTEEQLRVMNASKRLMKKFLLRKLAMAIAKWSEFTIFERNCAIFRQFLTRIRHRQLAAGFRRWESVVREWRKHKSLMQTIGSGLAIDLNKKKRERYRMLVLQK